MKDKLHDLSDYLWNENTFAEKNGLMSVELWSIECDSRTLKRFTNKKAVMIGNKSIEKYGFYIEAIVNGVVRVYMAKSFVAYVLSIAYRIVDTQDCYSLEMGENVQALCLDILGLQKVAARLADDVLNDIENLLELEDLMGYMQEFATPDQVKKFIAECNKLIKVGDV